jgi:hypothetical protein
MYDYNSPQAPRQAGPPITPLQVPTVHELMKMKLMQSKILDSTDSARKLIQPKNKPAWQENKVSYSLRYVIFIAKLQVFDAEYHPFYYLLLLLKFYSKET